jgi:hypothetical protein
MASSSREGKPETRQWIKDNNIKTILDIGPGIGNYSDLLKYGRLEDPDKGYSEYPVMNDIFIDKIDAVEIWEPYVEMFGLRDKYNAINISAAQDWTDWNYDLVIFGDVLEHMTKEDAIKVWERCSKQAKHAIISIPIIHHPQGPSDGNPYETHLKEDWTTQEVLETFKGIHSHEEYHIVGVFYATFNN